MKLRNAKFSGPCMCGAEDCEKCHPGYSSTPECPYCDQPMKLFIGEWICEECQREDDDDAD